MSHVIAKDSLYSARGGIIQLLNMLRGLTNDEIDCVVGAHNAAHLDDAVWLLVEDVEEELKG
jgi:hypothetical protein